MKDCCAEGGCDSGACDCSPAKENLGIAEEVSSPCPGVTYNICSLYRRLPQEEREERCFQGMNFCYVNQMKRVSAGGNHNGA